MTDERDGQEPLEVVAGRYELREVLGHGGSASVYRAWDRVLCAARAVKVLRTKGRLRDKRRRRFEAEARAMARVVHPNVLPVYDLGVDDEGQPWMVTAIAEGGNLADRVLREGPQPVRSMVSIAIGVLGALEVAHARGVVHRDIKPANILLDADGNPLVADFGIALLEGPDQDRQTRAGAALGTFSYMAPEQRIDARSVTPAADVYSVAATLYELISGESPVDLFAAGRGSPRWWGIPAILRPILQQALRQRPEERFATARELRLALARVLPLCEDAPAGLPPSERTEPTAVDERTDPGVVLASWYRRSLRDKATKLRDHLRALQRGEEGAEYDLRRLAHNLRGSGASFGFPLVSRAAAAAEDADEGSLPNRVAELVYVLRHVAEEPEEAPRAVVVAAVRDDELRAMLDVTLRRPSWEVEFVGDAAAAARLADTERIGVFILEDGLGNLHGPALLARLDAQANAGKTIVIGDDDEARRRSYLAMGVWRYVERPADPVLLASLVERLLVAGPRSQTLEGLTGVVDRQTFRLALLQHRQERRDGAWAVAAVHVPRSVDVDAAELARCLSAEWSEDLLVARWDPHTYLVLLADAGGVAAARRELEAILEQVHEVAPEAVGAAIVAGHARIGELLVGVIELAQREGEETVRVAMGPDTPEARVLVIDDDDDVAEVVRRILEGEGFQVRRLASGAQAEEVGRSWKPDLILLDIEMPDRDGFEVLQSLQADDVLREVPVLMLTSRARDSHVVLALELGADDYVLKPFDAGVLQARVRRTLRRHQRG